MLYILHKLPISIMPQAETGRVPDSKERGWAGKVGCPGCSVAYVFPFLVSRLLLP